MYKKIYVIGPVGSGKTTFATKLSELYNIKYYELDKVSWDDDHGNIKRSLEEALKIFNKIISKKSWVIEDVGREKFRKGLDEADIIYYIKLSRLKSYYRVIKRLIRQRLGKERYNHLPVFSKLLCDVSDVNTYYKGQKEKLKYLDKYKDKLVFVTNKDINKILRSEIYDNSN